MPELHGDAGGAAIAGDLDSNHPAGAAYLHHSFIHRKHQVDRDSRMKLRGEVRVEERSRGADITDKRFMVLRIRIGTGDFDRDRQPNAHAGTTLIQGAARDSQSMNCSLVLL
jgi:hypothetical protein